MTRSPTRLSLHRGLLLLALLSPLPSHAAASVQTVLRCQSETAFGKPGACPYLFDVLKGDHPFAKVFRQTLQQSGVPELSGPESPMQKLEIGKRSYISGDRCEAHNCGAHRYVFVYDPAHKKMAGLYLPDGGTARWFGQPDPDEAQALRQLFER